MGTFKVNGDISATGTISASSFLGNASSATYTHQWRTTAENPCTTSTDSNTGIFNVPDSRIYWISKTGTVIDQLNQWGYILDIGNNAERHQIWMTQSSGDMAHRGGNSNGWSGSWRVLLDSINYTSYTVTKTGSGASGTWGINITGNASTATALTTSAGSSSQAIYFSAGKPVALDWNIGNASVGERNCNNVTYNYCGYYTSNGPSTALGASTDDGSLYSQAYSSSWVSQIAQDYRNGNLFIRGKNNGSWQPWKAVLTSDNYTSYCAPAAHTHSSIEPKGIYTFTSSTPPNSFDFGISCGFVDHNSGFGNYGSVLTVRTYSGGGGTLQLYAPYSPTYGGTRLKARFGNYDSSGGNSWTSLKEIAWLSDLNSYLSLSGGTLTGTLTMNAQTGIQMIYRAGKDDVWIYPNGAPNFGIRYFEGNPDHMTFSASDNNNTIAGADLCINGNGDGTVTIRGKTILHAGNYTSYTVTKTGSGASGTWGINITGNAATATTARAVAWGNITGKPSLMPGTPGSIELFPGSSAGHGGFIDFHYNNSSSDYTARLINWNGKLQVDGATFNVGGKVELWTDGEGGNIRITSPNGSLWSIDALENSKLRFIWAEAQVPFSFQHDGVFNCAAIATSAWGPSLPGSGYWGQVYFKT